MKKWLYQNTWKDFPPLRVAIAATMISGIILCCCFIVLNKVESHRSPPLLYFYHQQNLTFNIDDLIHSNNCTDLVKVELADDRIVQFTCREVVDQFDENIHISDISYFFYLLIFMFLTFSGLLIFGSCLFFFLPGSIHNERCRRNVTLMGSVSSI